MTKLLITSLLKFCIVSTNDLSMFNPATALNLDCSRVLHIKAFILLKVEKLRSFTDIFGDVETHIYIYVVSMPRAIRHPTLLQVH